MFPLDDICLKCSFFIVLCATTLAAPGGLGSFTGSSSAAFSSATTNTHAGSVASAVSSANAFLGGFSHGSSLSSNNPDGTNHELNHHPGIVGGTGSYIGFGDNKPDSNKFDLMYHQGSGNTGNYNDKISHTQCSLCQVKEDKLRKNDNGEENGEKEEESVTEQDDDGSYDDGQYRPEYYYVHETESSDQYDYDQTDVKDSGNDKQETMNDEDFIDYASIETAAGYGSKLTKNVGTTYPSGNTNIGILKDSSHSTLSQTDINKIKENGYVNAGIPGSNAASKLGLNNNYRSTNVDTSGAVTSDKTNLDSTSGTNVGCFNSGSGSACGVSGTDTNQGPIKLDQSDLVQTPNLYVFKVEGNEGTVGSSNNLVHCGSAKPDEKEQYPSTSVGNEDNLPSRNTDNIGTQHKVHLPVQQTTWQWTSAGTKLSSFNQQSTGQWAGHTNTDKLSSGHTGNIDAENKPHLPAPQNTGQWTSAGTKSSSFDQQNTGQWAGHTNTDKFSSGHTGNIDVENKPHLPAPQNTGQWTSAGTKSSSFDQQNTGQWAGHTNTDKLSSGHTGNIDAGNKPHLPAPQNTGQWISAGTKSSSFDQQNTGQWAGHTNTDKLSSGHTGNIDAENKPHLPAPQNTGQWISAGTKSSSFDQQNTGQWAGHTNTDKLSSGHTGNIDAENKPHLPAPQNTGQWISAGTKSSSFDQQNTGQWAGHTNTDKLSSGHTGNIDAENKPHLPAPQNTGQWTSAGTKSSSFDQQNTGQWAGHTDTDKLSSGHTGNIDAENKPHLPAPQNTGQWTSAGTKSSSFDQQNTGQWAGHTYTDKLSSGHTGNIDAENKPHLPAPQNTGQWISAGTKSSSFDQQSTGQLDDHSSTNRPDCTYGVSSVPYLGGASTLKKIVPIPAETYTGVGSGGSYSDNKSTAAQGTTYETATGHGGTYYPEVQKDLHSPIDVDTGHVDKNTYKINLGNPFLYGEKGDFKPSLHTTGSPVRVPSYTGTVQTSSKPIGVGNPFLDGTLGITNTGGTHNLNSNKNDYNKEVISTDQLVHTTGSPVQVPSYTGTVQTTSKPIGGGNPFLDGTLGITNTGGTHNLNSNKNDYNKEVISTDQLVHTTGSPVQVPSYTGTVQTTSKPIGSGNPFLDGTLGITNTGGTHNLNSNKNDYNKEVISTDQLVHTTGSPVQVPSYTGTVQTTSKPIGSGNPFLDGTLGITNTGGTHNLNSNKNDYNKEVISTDQLVHTTGSPVQVPSYTGTVQTTSKPIGVVNPFLDGTLGITNTVDTHNFNSNINDHNKEMISTETSQEPVGGRNPFVTHGHGGHKDDSPIYNIGITIGGVPTTSTLPSVTTTVKPIGIGNLFSKAPGGPIIDTHLRDGHSSGISDDKNAVTESEITYPSVPIQSSPIDNDLMQFPKAINAQIGATSSEIYQNTKQGVKGSTVDNKVFGTIASSNAGALATGNVNTEQSNPLNIPSTHNGYNNAGALATGNVNTEQSNPLNIPSTHNGYNNAGALATGNVNTEQSTALNIPNTDSGYDNAGHDSSSLTGNVNVNKPTDPISNASGSYDYKATSQANGSGSSTNDIVTSGSHASINGNNVNNQYNPPLANAVAQSSAVANAGANAGANGRNFAASFSSSQASSSSFASSHSGSFTANGDPSNILQQLKGTWPFGVAKNINVNNTWPNVVSQAASFASSGASDWSGAHPVAVQS